jgi:hypothetical protein
MGGWVLFAILVLLLVSGMRMMVRGVKRRDSRRRRDIGLGIGLLVPALPPIALHIMAVSQSAAVYRMKSTSSLISELDAREWGRTSARLDDVGWGGW